MIIRFSFKHRAWIARIKIDGKPVEFVSRVGLADAMAMAHIAANQ